LGVKLVRLTAKNLHKLLLTLGFVGGILLVRAVVATIVRRFTAPYRDQRTVFWTPIASVSGDEVHSRARLRRSFDRHFRPACWCRSVWIPSTFGVP
jgi:hypothetical protein